MFNQETNEKPVGLVFGVHRKFDRDILNQFPGYVMNHAKTIGEAIDYLEFSHYDFILCFDEFADGSTFGFVCALGPAEIAKVIALVDGDSLKNYRQRKTGVPHFFYAGTKPELLRFFVDQLVGINRLLPVACPN